VLSSATLATALACASLCVAPLAGCAGGDESPSVRCERACTRDDTCDLAEESPFCRTDCAERVVALLPEFYEPFLSCYEDLRCDSPETECESEASDQVDRRQIDENFTDECQAKEVECSDGFNSAFCFVTHYYLEEYVDSARSCLAMTCDAVETCLTRELPFAPFGR
jgi:hypothetical protein